MAEAAPLVSIVMAVHNGERHLDAALSSILSQTYAALEIIVVDDGSSDRTAELLAQCDDPRLRILTNTSCQGLARSLNRGIEAATGDYVARMDADDVCHPSRIQRQVHYMQRHAEVGLLGTAYRLINDAGAALGIAYPPADDAAMRWRLLFMPPLAHPSAMMRRALLQRHELRYDPEWPTAQDYELWSRLLKHCRGANLPEVLFDYRTHAQSVSVTKRDSQDQWALRVSEREIAPFLPADMPLAVVAPLRRLLRGNPQPDDLSPYYLKKQLLSLAGSYMSRVSPDREGRREIQRDVIAAVLPKETPPLGVCRRLALLWRIFLLAPCETGRLAVGKVRRQLRRNGAADEARPQS